MYIYTLVSKSSEVFKWSLLAGKSKHTAIIKQNAPPPLQKNKICMKIILMWRFFWIKPNQCNCSGAGWVSRSHHTEQYSPAPRLNIQKTNKNTLKHWRWVSLENIHKTDKENSVYVTHAACLHELLSSSTALFYCFPSEILTFPLDQSFQSCGSLFLLCTTWPRHKPDHTARQCLSKRRGPVRAGAPDLQRRGGWGSGLPGF